MNIVQSGVISYYVACLSLASICKYVYYSTSCQVNVSHLEMFWKFQMNTQERTTTTMEIIKMRKQKYDIQEYVKQGTLVERMEMGRGASGVGDRE